MTITLSQQGFDELFQETVERSQHPDPDDVLDVVYKYPRRLGQGYWRRIELRQRLELIIGNLQMCDRMIILQPEQARQLLDYGDLKVSEIANIVGFVSHSYFTTAFRKKFGFCPKQYQMQQKKSV